MVRQEPETVIIGCSFVPENWPTIACVMAVGGWIVSRCILNSEDILISGILIASFTAVCRKHVCWGGVSVRLRIQVQR
jgi:type IV secretory pathway VirB3-like protein